MVDIFAKKTVQECAMAGIDELEGMFIKKLRESKEACEAEKSLHGDGSEEEIIHKWSHPPGARAMYWY